VFRGRVKGSPAAQKRARRDNLSIASSEKMEARSKRSISGGTLHGGNRLSNIRGMTTQGRRWGALRISGERGFYMWGKEGGGGTLSPKRGKMREDGVDQEGCLCPTRQRK